MIGYIFKNAIEILKRKPLMLWGVSLLCVIVTSLVQIGAGFIPIVAIPIVITLEAGMAALYLDGYNGKEVNSKQLFHGFTKECFPRVTAGMLWQYLWTIIWSFVPVMNVIKIYQYAFTPYILLTRPDVSPLEALKLSMKETYGYKGRMFGASILMVLILWAVILVSALVMIIPVIGWVVGPVAMVCAIILYPLFTGLVMAGFYEEAKRGNFKPVYPQYTYQAPQQNTNANAGAPTGDGWYCTKCGAPNGAGAAFCTKCGTPKNG